MFKHSELLLMEITYKEVFYRSGIYHIVGWPSRLEGNILRYFTMIYNGDGDYEKGININEISHIKVHGAETVIITVEDLKELLTLPIAEKLTLLYEISRRH